MGGTIDPVSTMVFARVASEGSFTAAARSLEMPKSTVSRRITELEARLGARLLERTTRKLRLTEAGRAYHAHALRAVEEVEAAEAAVQDLSASPRGRLRVTTPLDFSMMGPIFARFMARYPQIELEVVCADRVVDLVDEGFDVAIRAGALGDSRLVARSLGALTSSVVASPAFVARNGIAGLAKPEALADLDGLLFSAGAGRSGWVLERGEKRVTVRPRARLVANDFDLLLHGALGGVGVALLPTFRCADALAKGKLVRLLPAWSSFRVPIHAIYPSARHLSPKLRAFLDHVRDDARPWDAAAPVLRSRGSRAGAPRQGAS